ncbi:MAG: ATPase domain-containing protein [Candidatus Atabeyarchaeum deiterrae]
MNSSGLETASTGVPEIDHVLGGGCPRGTLVLVEETGSERSNYPSFFICMNFLKEGLLNKEYGIILLTEHSVPEYMQASARLGANLVPYRSAKLLTLIDAFSGYAGLMPKLSENEADITIESPTNTVKLFDEVRNLLMAFDGQGFRNRIRMIVDSVSTLVATAGFQKVWNLMLGLQPLHRMTGCTTMGMYYPGMNLPGEAESFERLADGVIDFQGREVGDRRMTENFIQIKKMRKSVFLKERVQYVRSEWEIKFPTRKM